MAPEESRRRARLDLGGVEKVKEECRNARRVDSIQNLALVAAAVAETWPTIRVRSLVPDLITIVLEPRQIEGNEQDLAMTLV